MTPTLIFLGLLMAAVVWWLVRQSVNVKPWVASAPSGAHQGVGQLATIKVGLGVFLAVATSLFALFVSAYAIRMELSDWRPLPEPNLLWVNTGILFVGSVGLQWAWRAATREQLRGVKQGLIVGGVCAIAFVIGQLIAWRQLDAAGYFITSNPANAFFYLLTSLHAVHLFGGLVAWFKTITRAWAGTEISSVRLGVELCAVYWHFLLVVWLILFGLLLST